MAVKQLKQFSAAKMGTRKRDCLQNVAKGFGIYPSPSPSASAIQDMQRNKAKGTFHANSNFPLDGAVPVYLDTASKWEHIIVADHGVYWSDGKRLTSLAGLKVLGWGEWCNGYRIVEIVPDPKPAPTGFLPAKGYWKKGDKDARIAKLCNFYADNFYGYYCKTRKAAHYLLDGPVFGPNCEKWTKSFQRRTGLVADGMVGPKTYAKLKQYGFKG